jgi:pimeloyl-ACP methyl ester carboxylesterase
LCKAFEHAGFRTLRFDNRDIGRSTHIDAPVPDIAAVVEARRQGREPELPYTLSDMAADTVGLLDALGIARAHVFGVSLGGMVAQVMAIEHRERVRSLSIFMSQSGNPDLAPSKPEAMAILSKRAPDPREDREGYLRHQVELNRTLGSPDYPAPEAGLRAFATLAAERAWNPAGAARQLAAARGATDRRPALRALSIPALVVHGVEDPLIPVEHGADIARAIKGAWLLELNGMGHDLPAELTDLFVSAVGANCVRA